jgi:hypothetical protein
MITQAVINAIKEGKKVQFLCPKGQGWIDFKPNGAIFSLAEIDYEWRIEPFKVEKLIWAAPSLCTFSGFMSHLFGSDMLWDKIECNSTINGKKKYKITVEEVNA